MRGCCQLHRLLTLYPQGVENKQQTYWQVWMLSKFHHLATREEWGTQDQRLRARPCPTNGKFQHLRVTVLPNPLGLKSFLLPSDS